MVLPLGDHVVLANFLLSLGLNVPIWKKKAQTRCSLRAFPVCCCIIFIDGVIVELCPETLLCLLLDP